VAALSLSVSKTHILHPAGGGLGVVCTSALVLVGGGEHVHVFVQKEHFIGGCTCDVYFPFGVKI